MLRIEIYCIRVSLSRSRHKIGTTFYTTLHYTTPYRKAKEHEQHVIHNGASYTQNPIL